MGYRNIPILLQLGHQIGVNHQKNYLTSWLFSALYRLECYRQVVLSHKYFSNINEIKKRAGHYHQQCYNRRRRAILTTNSERLALRP